MIDLPFDSFRFNIHSQNGEDGVINELLNRLNFSNNNFWCVEFGAWDGIHLSNTFALVERGWNAVYIEGDLNRYKDLLVTASKFKKIVPINSFVSKGGDMNSLDEILSKTDIPADFDLLSIDIDSYDCDVWDSLKNYTPKIVVIEINSSIPPGIYWRHSDKTPGNTFTATVALADDKGYTLVCHTGNLFFIRNDLVDTLKIPPKYLKHPELLFNPQTLQIKQFVPGGSFIRRFFRKYIF